MVIGTLPCGSCILNAKEENARGNKPLRDSLETVIGNRCGIVYGMWGHTMAKIPYESLA